MADTITIEIKGLKELEEKLSTFPSRMTKQVMGSALKKTGQVFLSEMQNQCPVLVDKTPGSNALEPGELRASLNSKVSIRPQRLQASVTIGADSQHQHVSYWVNFGHIKAPHRNGKKNKNAGTTAANAFVRRAFDAKVNEATATFINEVAKGVDDLMQPSSVGAVAA